MSRVLPILFNTEMTAAILDGRKTATRRLIMPHNRKKAKKQGYIQGSGLWIDPRTDNGDKEGHIKDYSISSCWTSYSWYIEKYADYKPGDILYVRETWQHLQGLNGNEQIIEGTGRYYYAATDMLPLGTYVDSRGITHENIPWRPSIYMPKEAARIWLKVTDVRPERLQDITHVDIIMEGVKPEYIDVNSGEKTRNDFSQLWNSTIKKSDLNLYGWDANPWVWVIEFERCKKPEG